MRGVVEEVGEGTEAVLVAEGGAGTGQGVTISCNRLRTEICGNTLVLTTKGSYKDNSVARLTRLDVAGEQQSRHW